MKIIDDLLSEKEFKSIQKIIEDKNFPWYFVDGNPMLVMEVTK